MSKVDDNKTTARRRRTEVIARLRLREEYKRGHTPTGVHRRLEEAPKAEPEVPRDPTDTRLKNLLRRHPKP